MQVRAIPFPLCAGKDIIHPLEASKDHNLPPVQTRILSFPEIYHITPFCARKDIILPFVDATVCMQVHFLSHDHVMTGECPNKKYNNNNHNNNNKCFLRTHFRFASVLKTPNVNKNDGDR